MRVGSPGATSSWILERSRKHAGLQPPAACATRAGGNSNPNFENCDLFRAQSPDTGRGVHDRSWRANRDFESSQDLLPCVHRAVRNRAIHPG